MRKWECQAFFFCGDDGCCLSILNFNSQRSTVLDGAVCIINDVQIPHMKGLHCGLDKRLCVLFFFLPHPVYSSNFFLVPHLCLIFHHIFSRPLFFNTFCNQLIWKSHMDKCQWIYQFLYTLWRLCSCIQWCLTLENRLIVLILSAGWTMVSCHWARRQQKTISLKCCVQYLCQFELSHHCIYLSIKMSSDTDTDQTENSC